MLPPVATLPGILRYAGGYFGRVRVTNNTGSGLPAGHPIYVEGAGGSLLAQEAAGGADLSTHVTLEAIANGQSGWAAAYWDAAGFDVGGSGWSVGDWLYVAAGGGWTTTAPTGVKWRQAAGTVVASDRVLFFPGAALTTWFPAIGDPTSGHVVYGDGDDWLSGTKDSAGIVDKSSDQTIGGKKAFSSAPTVPDLILTGCRIVTSDTTLCDCGTASDPHWHIASDGDDSTGDGTDEAPWLTLEKAMDVISDYVIADGVTLKIVCAAGAYVIGTTKTMAGGPLTVGTGKVEIYGDSATPANVRFTALANNGDTSIDIDEIEDLGGNSFKYWLEGDPDLSAVSTLGRLCAQNCGNP